MPTPALGTPQGRNQLAWLLVRKYLCPVWSLCLASPLELPGLSLLFYSSWLIFLAKFRLHVFQCVSGEQFLWNSH